MFASTSRGTRSLIVSRVVARRCVHATARVFEAGPSSGPSELESALRAGLKEAMKTRNRAASTTLKAILADITYLAKSSPNPSQPLAQENVLSAIRKGISQRTQAAESYAPGTASAHGENFANLQQEVDLLQSYLPPSPTAETVKGYIDEIIAGLSEEVRARKGVTGSIMKALWDKLGEAKGLVDKKEVGKWVNEALRR